MKKILILSACLLSAPAFGMGRAFNALCAGARYFGASYFPLTAAYTHTKGSLTPFTEESFGITHSLDETTGTWTKTRESSPKDYQLINVADKEIPVEKNYVLGPAFCYDHTLSHLLGRSKYSYSVTVPDIWPTHRLKDNDPNDRGLTASEYKQHLEDYVKKDRISDNDGSARLLAELIKSPTKEEIEAVFQHEKGHGERSAGLRLASSGPIIASTMIGVDRVLMKKIGKNIASLKKPILRTATKSSVAALLGIAYHNVSSALYHVVLRHEEYKADDNVQKEQIPGQISFLQKCKITEEITERELKKNGFKDDSWSLKKIINPTFATHPTDAQRIARLQKRFSNQNQKRT